MLGQPMQVRVNDKLIVKLAPFSREEARLFVKDGGLGLHSVSRYAMQRQALTVEDEEEWYGKVRKDKSSYIWGIWDYSSKEPRLIGNSSLTHLEEFPLRQMVTGSMIFDQKYWGRGIATATHKARTWYAFNQLNLTRLKSAVIEVNIGSEKALSRSGYFFHSLERNVNFVDGKFHHQRNLECLNPSDIEWQSWWGDDEPSPEAIKAREVTKESLAWADANVTLL